MDGIRDLEDETTESLRRLERLLGHRDARAIVQDIIDDLLSGLGSLEWSLEVSDEKKIRFYAHGLCGVLSTFGLSWPEAECRRFLACNMDQAPSTEMLSRDIHIVSSHFRRLLANNAAGSKN